jgi:16S rRNA (cytosine1402-N4)-methyltransferase
MKNGVFDDEPVKDEFGRTNKPLSLVNKKPIVASIQELKQNTRSRSAKLRVAFRNKKND